MHQKLKLKIRFLFLLALLIWCKSFSYAQLTINAAPTPAQLVQNVLLGAGVTASNITYTGSAQARAGFTANSTNLGLGGGVILSAGNANDATGPVSNTSSTDFTLPGDATLTQINLATNPFATPGDQTFDASILEFDFVPQGDTIKFKYVFASEEFESFVGSRYNDVFAFLISGPNPSGGNYTNTNLAGVPGTSLPVSINNVNNGNNNAGPCQNCTYYTNNSSGTTVAFYGFTTVLTATARVFCGQTYHIKLAIADVADGTLDSGVFLEAGSFSSNPVITVSPDMAVGLGDTLLFEGCGTGNFTISRSSGINNPLDIRVDNFGTAVAGDYTSIVDTIHFNPGQTSVTLSVSAPFDGVTEGIESVLLRFITPPNSCGISDTTYFTFYINELPPIILNVAANDTVIECAGDSVTITATYSGNLTPVTILWNTPQMDSVAVIKVAPLATTVYSIIIRDSCGNTFAYDTIRIRVYPIVPISILYPNDTVVCMNDSLILPAIAIGGQGLLSYEWSGQGVGDSILNYLVPQGTTNPTITVRDQCSSVKTKVLDIFGAQPNADFSFIVSPDLGSPVFFANASSPTAITHNWSFGDGHYSEVQDPQHQYPDSGVYQVYLAVSDRYNCVDTARQEVTILPDFFVYVPNAFTPGKDDLNTSFKAYGWGVSEFELKIFNRWGQEVFKTNDLNEGWYGKNCEIGVYIYTLVAKGYKSGTKNIKGTVTLIK